MQFSVHSLESAAQANVDLVIGYIAEDHAAGWLEEYARTADIPGLDDARGIEGDLTYLHACGGEYPRFCLIGIGPGGRADWSDRVKRLATIRKTMPAALRGAAKLGMQHVVFAAASLEALGLDGPELKECLDEVVYAAELGLYTFDACKTVKKDVPTPKAFSLIPGKHSFNAEDFMRSLAEAEAVAVARDLVNTPANLLTPMHFAAKAREAARDLPLTCTVLDRQKLEQEGLQAMLAVSSGSLHEPALICLEYTPSGAEQMPAGATPFTATDAGASAVKIPRESPVKAGPLVLIGKGLTFDSGGISLKPALGMHEMKSDMAGAAAVFAVMCMIARLGVSRRVIGLLPCAENMPDAGAVRPGDVVTTLDGKTVEIINTDAEGRLVLCDALTFAQRKYEPGCMVDIATLTGACVVALGSETAGLFATDDALAATIADNGFPRGEHFWRMPLWDAYAEGLKSPIADLANVGPREGGAITSAVFLKQFVKDDVPWAHLDIAGTAFKGKKSGDAIGGATGFGVRTLAALVLGH